MRVQGINSNNYQSRNQNKKIGFEATNVHTLIQGAKCHAGQSGLCIKFVEAVAARLRQAAKDLGLMEEPNKARVMLFHAEEGLHVWLVDSRTRLARDLYMANPGAKDSVLWAATDAPNIEMDSIQISNKALHRKGGRGSNCFK